MWRGAMPSSQIVGAVDSCRIGWAIQFVGHHYEGRKPAFVDDVTGLIVGPLFVVVELAFLLGLRHELKEQIEARAGGVRVNPNKAAA